MIENIKKKLESIENTPVNSDVLSNELTNLILNDKTVINNGHKLKISKN